MRRRYLETFRAYIWRWEPRISQSGAEMYSLVLDNGALCTVIRATAGSAFITPMWRNLLNQADLPRLQASTPAADVLNYLQDTGKLLKFGTVPRKTPHSSYILSVELYHE